MSRHQLKSLPRYEVFVGWDPPLQTWFCQVYDRTRSETENPFIWLGPGRLVSWLDIVAALAPYAEVPTDIKHALEADRRLNR